MGNLSVRYIGPLKIVQIIRKVSYKLALPLDCLAAYPIFMYLCFIAIFRISLTFFWYSIQLDKRLTFIKEMYPFQLEMLDSYILEIFLWFRFSEDIVLFWRLLVGSSSTCIITILNFFLTLVFLAFWFKDELKPQWWILY